ncbi:MAG TPA: Fur family transcriptional regulator [Tepidisphaeraceae bacterium]|jgi:Fur family ferric uptake transcriptional regulator|nr:Fur family transcriptional regulator [Tepidisphaeraceae bacterium]
MPSPAEVILKAHDLRRTPVRLGVLDVLAGGKHPLDAAEIIGKLSSHIDRVTVYRTLNTFVDKKIIHRVRGEDRSWRYAIGDAATRQHAANHSHPHFVCDDCGEVECLDAAQIPTNFVQSMKVESDYRITYPEVTLHGSCPKCSKADDAE